MTDSDGALGERLRAAREAAGVSEQEAAGALGLTPPLLASIENGTREVAGSELLLLAAMYGRKVSELARPQSPLDGIGVEFRKVFAQGPEHHGLEHEEPELLMVAAELQRLGDDFLDLVRRAGVELPRRYPATAPLPEHDLEGGAEDLALEERRRLGLGDGPLPQLRDVLENDVGLRVFAIPMPSRVAGVTVTAEPLGTCVVMNAHHPAQRRRWTLAHEYAHVLTGRGHFEITVMGAERHSAEEKFADLFAANLLMPRSGLRRRHAELVRARGGKFAALGDLFQLARTYGVSLTALIGRLEDLQLIRRGAYDGIEIDVRRPDDPWRGSEADGGGDPTVELNLSYDADEAELLPMRFRYLALELYAKGEITKQNLADYLRIHSAGVRRVAETLGMSRDITPGGAAQAARLLDAAP